MLLTQLAAKRLNELQQPAMLTFTRADDGSYYKGVSGCQPGPGPLFQADVQRMKAGVTIVIVYNEVKQ